MSIFWLIGYRRLIIRLALITPILSGICKMFASKVFRVWFITALGLWFILFNLLNDLQFLADHWYYPVIMILGAFVAGVTPEGGGAVAFPILNIFLSIDREMARDFSLMIQSIGMTSASLFILTHKDNRLATYKPLF